MKIRIGYELIYDCPQPTPMILTLSVHYTRVSDIIIPDHLIADPPVPLTAYRDSFGNWCSRIVAPEGLVRLSADALVKDTGQPDRGCLGGETDAGGRTARRDPAVPVGEPILRDRSPVRDSLATVRQLTDRMGARPGDLRPRPPPHHIWLRARTFHRRPGRLSKKGPACAVITRTSPSRSVAA